MGSVQVFMNVTLVGYLQLSPDYRYGKDWQVVAEHEAEWLAAAAMRSTRTTQPFFDILQECNTELAGKRVQAAVRMEHFTVAGMTDFMFVIDGVSRALSHQLVRHRTAWFLQQSQRAVNIVELPVVHPLTVLASKFLAPQAKAFIKHSKEFYQWLLSHGIPKEDARYYMPNASTTRLVMKIDGSNLLHLLKLRLDRGAQWEIRELAGRIHREVMKVAPNLFDKELEEYWW